MQKAGMDHRTVTASIGKKEAELIGKLSGTGKRVFGVSEAAKLLETEPGAVSDLVVSLTKKKKLLRIEKGRYILLPPSAWESGKYSEDAILIASQLVSPYYLSYWTALSFYGWTEQPSRTVFIATTKRKAPITLTGMRFQFVLLRENRYFGATSTWAENQKIEIASKEKAIVDGLDQPRYCGEIVEVVKGIWNGRAELDWDRVLEYALRMNNGAILKRLGFLLEVLEISKPSFLKEIKKHLTAGYVDLEPGAASQGKHNRTWRLRLNVLSENLTEWRYH